MTHSALQFVVLDFPVCLMLFIPPGEFSDFLEPHGGTTLRHCHICQPCAHMKRFMPCKRLSPSVWNTKHLYCVPLPIRVGNQIYLCERAKVVLEKGVGVFSLPHSRSVPLFSQVVLSLRTWSTCWLSEQEVSYYACMFAPTPFLQREKGLKRYIFSHRVIKAQA